MRSLHDIIATNENRLLVILKYDKPSVNIRSKQTCKRIRWTHRSRQYKQRTIQLLPLHLLR